VFGCNLQCEVVRKWTPERNAIGHTPDRFKRSKGVKLNGILECQFPLKTRTVHTLFRPCFPITPTRQPIDPIISFAPSVFRRNLQCELVKKVATPRGMPLVTCLQELQAEQRRETQWHSSSVNLCQKTLTVPAWQPIAPGALTSIVLGGVPSKHLLVVIRNVLQRQG
jgi:hypothetical protein